MFLIVPVGHDEARVRRLPVATIAIVVVNVLVFALTIGAINAQEEKIAATREALDALKMRAFLELEGGGARGMGAMANVIVDAKARNLHDLGEKVRARVDDFWTAFTAGEKVSEHHPLFVEYRELSETLARTMRDSVVTRWGLVPADFSVVNALTSTFLHGGYLHLIGNMLLLVLAGAVLEDVLGVALYLGLYLAAGFAGAGAHALAAAGSIEPCIGASGAVAGLMGAFLVRFFRAKIRFWYFVLIIFRPIWGTVSLPAFVVLPIWFATQLAQGAGFALEADNIAYMAHVGGFVLGVAVAGAMRLVGVGRESAGEEADAEIRDIRESSMNTSTEHLAAHRALTEGRFEDAVALLTLLLEQRPESVTTRLSLVRALLAAGREREAGEHALALATRLGETGNLPLLRELADSLAHATHLGETAARVVYQAARTFDEQKDFVEALRRYDDFAARFADSPLAPKALYRTITLSREKLQDPTGARERIVRLRERYGDHPLAREFAASP
ncbi:MAG: rhomboid family intramembrane serine protease [Deltaproteobacteria bacterium]|nr:rhomboid family intramembrane serine protease [Deltaproteobacteria bacterium]